MPDPARFAYTFDRIAEVIERWLEQIGFRRFGLFVQDYQVGFTAAWDGLRNALWKSRSTETEEALLPFLSLDGIRLVYQHGHRDLSRISPDNWNMDFRFMAWS